MGVSLIYEQARPPEANSGGAVGGLCCFDGHDSGLERSPPLPETHPQVQGKEQSAGERGGSCGILSQTALPSYPVFLTTMLGCLLLNVKAWMYDER